MEISISSSFTEKQIRRLVNGAASGDTFNVESPDHFALLRGLLIEYKKVGLRVCLLDEDGYIVKQVSSRARENLAHQGLNDTQLKVVKALERVLEHCAREGITLVGYSDQLVAIPTRLAELNLQSEQAREIDDHGVYLGADQVHPKNLDE